MCWQCDNPHRTTDDYLNVVREIVDGHGWAIHYVEDEDRPFAYTVGLTDLGMPELLITGLPPEASGRLLNSTAHDMVDNGTVLQPAMHIDFQSEFLLEVVELDHPDVHLTCAVAICGPDVRALQLVWTDDFRHWPWDRGWSHGRCSQPVFGIRCPVPR